MLRRCANARLSLPEEIPSALRRFRERLTRNTRAFVRALVRLCLEKGEAIDLLTGYSRSQCLRSAFTRPNAHRFFDLGYKDFAIAVLACFGGSQYCLDSQ